jgi:hypothetical protein
MGTGMIRPRTIRPRTKRPRTFCPRLLRPRTLFLDVFTSPYFSSLKESKPTEFHQPWIGWAFSLT